MSSLAAAVIGMVVSVALFASIACTSEAASSIEKAERMLAATATAKEQVPGGGLAERVKTSRSVTITLHDFRFTDKAEWVAPKEGMGFLLLDVSFANAGPEEVTIGSRHFRLVDAA